MEHLSQPQSTHREFFRIRPGGGQTVVVFIHGIMGSPLQFSGLAASLGPDIDYISLLLPGHGGTPAEYARSGMAGWQRHVDERVAELAGQFKHVLLVGHSMGGLLAISTAMNHPGTVRGLFLLALPLKIGLSRSFLSRSLAVAFGRPGRDRAADQARQSTSITFSHWYQYIRGSTHVLALFAKARKTRNILPKLDIPLWAIQSGRDEIVSRRAISCLPAKPGNRRVVLKSSSHYEYADKDQENLVQLFHAFIRLTAPVE